MHPFWNERWPPKANEKKIRQEPGKLRLKIKLLFLWNVVHH
jgi:hypothetical protein